VGDAGGDSRLSGRAAGLAGAVLTRTTKQELLALAIIRYQYVLYLRSLLNERKKLLFL
jgi:hypothetical protein